jgi:hypothetical protein
VTLTSPVAGATLGSATPALSGSAGTSPGDNPQVTVRLYAGTSATGTPLRTFNVTPNASGSWSASTTPSLADGAYTVVAEQDDNVGNAGFTAPRTFTIQAASGYRTTVLADSPVGYWRLGETAGTAAGDETSGGNPGTLQGGVQTGVVGAILGDADTAMHFDGADDAIDAGDPSSGALDLGSGNATAEAWIRTSSPGVGAIVGKENADGSSTPYWDMLVTNVPGREGDLRTKIFDGTNTIYAYSAVPVNDGNWHHVTVVIDRSVGVIVDVDGIRTTTAGTLTGTLSNPTSLTIGKIAGYPTFLGDIDEVAIYRSALSSARIAAHAVEATKQDTTAPAPTLTSPAGGGTVADTTPRFAGVAASARGDVSRITLRVYPGGAASGAPTETVPLVVDKAHRWTLEPGKALTPGTYTAQVEQDDTAGNAGLSPAVTFTVTAGNATAGDPELITAGDIAGCDTIGDEQTASLLANMPGTIQTLGDNVYLDGSPQQFTDCFDPTWGQFKARIRPGIGDHEYRMPDAAGYFGYYGAAAGEPGKGYYSYDLGAWHVVVTNGVCEDVPGGCAAGSPQMTWLQSDLAASQAACTMVVIAGPLYSSGSVHGPEPSFRPFWQTLIGAGADVVLSGDEHQYERFAPMTADGRSDPVGGLRQFIVGTGGRGTSPINGPQPNSEAREDDTLGLLKLTLHGTSYDWQFVPVAGATFSDTGSASCH